MTAFQGCLVHIYRDSVPSHPLDIAYFDPSYLYPIHLIWGGSDGCYFDLVLTVNKISIRIKYIDKAKKLFNLF